MFNSKVFSNHLTKLIESKPDIDIEEVLLHQDFPSTIENGNEILYRRILKIDKDEEQWFHKIVNYALFNKTPPRIYAEFNHFKQINKNSSNFLEQCNEKFLYYFFSNHSDKNIVRSSDLRDYISDIIDRFMSPENKLSTDPMYAGNFQRFVTNFISVLEIEKTIQKLIPFLVFNCRILAYNELIMKIIVNFMDDCDKETIRSLLTCMMYHAYLAVKYVRSHKKVNLNSSKPPKFNIENQPLNTAKEPIPLIDLFVRDEIEKDLNNERKNVKIHFENVFKYKAKFDNVEDAEIDAYLILMTLKRCIAENSSIVTDYIRDEDPEYPIIDALLYCGTRSPSKSLISLEAFKILGIVFNGSKRYEIQTWNYTEYKKMELFFYKLYADEMVFDPKCPTYKMIHALPVFWSHRYNKDSYKLSEEEMNKIDVSDYFGKKDIKKNRIREKGETALEIFQPCLICEPPISSQLINTALIIFDQLATERRRLKDKKIMNEQDIENTIYLDGTILDFYQHHFDFGSKFFNTKFMTLLSNKVIDPLVAMDQYYDVEKLKRRPVFNGFLLYFLKRMSESYFYPFFVLKNELLTQMGRNRSLIVIKSIFIYDDYNQNGLKEITLDNTEAKVPESINDDEETQIEIIVDKLNPLDKKRKKNPDENSISAEDDDINDMKDKNSQLLKELEDKSKKIKGFEEVFLSTQLEKNSKERSESNLFIDMNEEQEFHTNPRKIGEGATSITYKVIDKRTKIPMCKKVIKYKEGQTDIKDAKNALKEFQILQSISHPCICDLIGINIQEIIKIPKDEEEDDDEEENREIPTIALFLEYVDYSLSDVLKMKINNTTKVRIVLDVVHAMNYLHKHGMMHRDLKVDNIRLNAFFETKIVDFGLATISEFVLEDYSYVGDSLTKGIGTLMYMSPEMAREEKYKNKTDVYSFGIVLHVIFTGDLPKQNIQDKLNGVPIKLPRSSSSISKFCVNLIEKCLSHSPSKRPSFEEILNQMRENSYQMASGVDPSILSRRDKELEFIENYK